MRKIGGVDQGKFFNSPEARKTLDGFEDYKLFIKLLMMEIKILLMPSFLSLMRS